MDVVMEDQYSYDKAAYNQLIHEFLRNESLVREINDLKQQFPEALNLVRDDWEEVLKSSAIYKKWGSEVFKMNQVARAATNVQFVCDNMPAAYHANLLLACEILYDKNTAYSEKAAEFKQFRIDIVQTGPIQELVRAFARCRGYECYNYASVRLPTCRNVHNSCFEQSLRNTKKTFCLYAVKFFNGESVKRVSPSFVENRKLKSLVGVAVLDIKGITRFGKEFHTIKLNGDCCKVMMTTRGCLLNNVIEENDDDIFDDVNKRTLDADEKEYDVVLPDNIAQPLFNSFQIAKKSRLMIEDK